MELNIKIFEEDGSIFAEIDGGQKEIKLASFEDIKLKTEKAFNNVVEELLCDLECFHERENISLLISETEEKKNFKKGFVEYI